VSQLLDLIGDSERFWMSLEVNLVEVVGVEPTSKRSSMLTSTLID
jgi:hypothetical protein